MTDGVYCLPRTCCSSVVCDLVIRSMRMNSGLNGSYAWLKGPCACLSFCCATTGQATSQAHVELIQCLVESTACPGPACFRVGPCYLLYANQGKFDKPCTILLFDYGALASYMVIDDALVCTLFFFSTRERYSPQFNKAIISIMS